MIFNLNIIKNAKFFYYFSSFIIDYIFNLVFKISFYKFLKNLF